MCFGIKSAWILAKIGKRDSCTALLNHKSLSCSFLQQYDFYTLCVFLNQLLLFQTLEGIINEAPLRQDNVLVEYHKKFNVLFILEYYFIFFNYSNIWVCHHTEQGQRNSSDSSLFSRNWSNSTHNAVSSLQWSKDELSKYDSQKKAKFTINNRKSSVRVMFHLLSSFTFFFFDISTQIYCLEKNWMKKIRSSLEV